jgi:hypothetical protein
MSTLFAFEAEKVQVAASILDREIPDRIVFSRSPGLFSVELNNIMSGWYGEIPRALAAIDYYDFKRSNLDNGDTRFELVRENNGYAVLASKMGMTIHRIVPRTAKVDYTALMLGAVVQHEGYEIKAESLNPWNEKVTAWNAKIDRLQANGTASQYDRHVNPAYTLPWQMIAGRMLDDPALQLTIVHNGYPSDNIISTLTLGYRIGLWQFYGLPKNEFPFPKKEADEGPDGGEGVSIEEL